CFVFTHTATTATSPLSLHDALPIFGADPTHFQALHLLGVICIQSGDLERGAALIEAALEVQPDDAAALGNLATALNGLGRREQRSEEHTSELQSLTNLVCRLLLEDK